MPVLSLVHSGKALKLGVRYLLALATAGSYWRFKAYKFISSYKETRLREYINRHNQVNLFLKFFVTVKLVQPSAFKVMNNQLINNQKL